MSEKRLVWDLPLRLFHWLLVISIAASWTTAELGFDYTQIHFYLGYWTLGLIAFRIIWGFIGPKHARFASFLTGPGKVVAYIKSFGKRDSPPAVGHNPGGGLMVVLMLLMVGAQATTGLFLIDNTEIWIAPYHAAVSSATADKLMKFHHLNFDVLLWVISLHILAIIFYRVYKGQNLVAPMLTGGKPASSVPPQQAIAGSQIVKALIVAAVCAGGVYLLLKEAPPPPAEDYTY